MSHQEERELAWQKNKTKHKSALRKIHRWAMIPSKRERAWWATKQTAGHHHFKNDSTVMYTREIVSRPQEDESVFTSLKKTVKEKVKLK